MRKKIKNILLSLATVCCAAATFLSAQEAFPTRAEDAVLTTSSEIQAEYLYQDEFSIPRGVIALGGKEYQAEENALVFPDGSIYYGEESYALTQTGVYTVIYSATVKGEKINKEKDFTVKQNISEIEMRSSTLEYVDAISMSSTTDIPGLKVGLKEGDTFHYNKVLLLVI